MPGLVKKVARFAKWKGITQEQTEANIRKKHLGAQAAYEAAPLTCREKGEPRMQFATQAEATSGKMARQKMKGSGMSLSSDIFEAMQERPGLCGEHEKQSAQGVSYLTPETAEYYECGKSSLSRWRAAGNNGDECPKRCEESTSTTLTVHRTAPTSRKRKRASMISVSLGRRGAPSSPG
jgi:hypothetical protein